MNPFSFLPVLVMLCVVVVYSRVALRVVNNAGIVYRLSDFHIMLIVIAGGVLGLIAGAGVLAILTQAFI